MKSLLLALALATAAVVAAPPHAALADDLERAGLSDGSNDLGEGGGPKPCGFGSRVECSSQTIERCVEWKYQPTITVSPTGGGAGYTLVCGTKVITVTRQYKD